MVLCTLTTWHAVNCTKFAAIDEFTSLVRCFARFPAATFTLPSVDLLKACDRSALQVQVGEISNDQKRTSVGTTKIFCLRIVLILAKGAKENSVKGKEKTYSSSHH